MATFIYESRRLPPEEVSVAIAAGRSTTPTRDVVLSIATDDYLFGQRSAYEIVVWGDVDPNMDGRIQATEGGSERIPFTPSLDIVLSCGAGPKTVNVKVRNQALRESATSSATIELLDGDPHVSVLWRSRRKRFGGVGTGSMKIIWSSSHDFTRWDLMAAPTKHASRSECTLISTGSGAWEAGEQVESVIDSGDYWDELEIVPQSGGKVAKIFVLTSAGWSD